MNEVWDVLIVGAGPAGAAAAGFLAQAGWKVLVLEKDVFPRFHIGESLLPMGLEVLHHLGVHLSQAPFALRKDGAVLCSEFTQQKYRVSFQDTLPGGLNYAYQVERAGFDAAIAQRAEELGAHVLFDQKVGKVLEDETGVTATCGQKQFRARFLIDATGQNALLAKSKLGRQWVRGMGRYATFSHFENVTSSLAQETFARGDIQVLLCPSGWSWLIPLPGNRLSVGLVHQDGHAVGKPEKDFQTHLESSPFTSNLLKGARHNQPIRRCSDFSYYGAAPQTDRMTTLGDACAFLDPIFSSGVSLSLYAARSISFSMAHSLKNDLPLQLKVHHNRMNHGYQVFERIIERFYRPGWTDNVLFADHKPERFVAELNTIFAGYVWREDNSWQDQLLKAKRRTITYQPAFT